VSARLARTQTSPALTHYFVILFSFILPSPTFYNLPIASPPATHAFIAGHRSPRRRLPTDGLAAWTPMSSGPCEGRSSAASAAQPPRGGDLHLATHHPWWLLALGQPVYSYQRRGPHRRALCRRPRALAVPVTSCAGRVAGIVGAWPQLHGGLGNMRRRP
jgi:hypothetical protein